MHRRFKVSRTGREYIKLTKELNFMKKRLAVICVFLIVFMGITTVASALSFTLSVPGHGGYDETNTEKKADSNRAKAKVSFSTLNPTAYPAYAHVYFCTGPSAATNSYAVTNPTTIQIPYNSGYGYYKDPYRLRVSSNASETTTFTAKGTFTP